MASLKKMSSIFPQLSQFTTVGFQNSDSPVSAISLDVAKSKHTQSRLFIAMGSIVE